MLKLGRANSGAVNCSSDEILQVRFGVALRLCREGRVVKRRRRLLDDVRRLHMFLYQVR